MADADHRLSRSGTMAVVESGARMTSEHHEPIWQPSASLENLRTRARVLRAIREFFHERGVLEVETPALSSATVTDLHLHSLSTSVSVPGRDAALELWLQTSPEFAMKRLLAAGSGPIYQVCKAFRDLEGGRFHNPEFTMLEWYRPGWNHHALMDEIDEMTCTVLGVGKARRLSYGEALSHYGGIDDAYRDGWQTLRKRAMEQGVADVPDLDCNGWLSLIMTQIVEPAMRHEGPVFIDDFPADQAALSRVREGSPPVAERFELYIDGVELANGYHELTDAAEQRRRFDADNRSRAAAGLAVMPVDNRLLAALTSGLPMCAGVALGVDRLVMLAAGADTLQDVVAFPVDRA